MYATRAGLAGRSEEAETLFEMMIADDVVRSCRL